jgi:hypothetical protein
MALEAGPAIGHALWAGMSTAPCRECQVLFLYWLIYGMWTAGAVQYSRAKNHRNERVMFVIATALTALFIGLRYQVGGDWGAYRAMYNQIYFQTLIDSLRVTDPGYAMLNWIFSRNDIGVWAVNLVCGILFMAGVGRLAAHQTAPWLAVVVAVPYLIIVVAMGYTRQAAAIGVICFGIADASERSLGRLVIYVAVATLFHKTAILLLPVMIAPVATKKPLVGLLGCVFFVVLFLVFLSSTSTELVTNYAQSNYDSQGATIRIAMNVLAASVMLLMRNRMTLSPYQRSFWTYNALLAFASVPALLSLSASSGVDRLSLFLIPLQLVALSRLPAAWGRTPATSAALTFGVIAYSFAVQFVWLNYATNVNAWLPYDNVALPLQDEFMREEQ